MLKEKNERIEKEKIEKEKIVNEKKKPKKIYLEDIWCRRAIV